MDRRVVLGAVSDDEARSILRDAGVLAVRRMAGFVPGRAGRVPMQLMLWGVPAVVEVPICWRCSYCGLREFWEWGQVVPRDCGLPVSIFDGEREEVCIYEE